MIKTCLIVGMLVITFHGKCQGTMNVNYSNILYRGYDNKIQLSKANLKQNVIIHSSDVELMLLDKTSETYRARVSGTSKDRNIYILSKNLKDTLSVYTFRIANLPPPSLFFGDIIDQGNGMLSKEISCKYPENLLTPTSVTFEIIEYEIIVAGTETTCRGVGGVLSEENTEWLKSELDKPRENQFLIITIQTKIKGPDGTERKKSGTFYLR